VHLTRGETQIRKGFHFSRRTVYVVNGVACAVQWFLQITLAVRYMHSCKVLHRDIKTENVFLNKSATLCKIGMCIL